MVTHSFNPRTWELNQSDFCGFKVNLIYIIYVKQTSKKTNTKTQREQRGREGRGEKGKERESEEEMELERETI